MKLQRRGSEDVESTIHFEEKETNEATLTELEGRSFGISMLPCVRQCMCIFYSSYYHTAVAIYNYSVRWLYVHKENKSVNPNVLAG